MKPQIMIFTSDASRASDLLDKLRWGAFRPLWCRDVEHALGDAMLETDLVLVDLSMGKQDACDFIERARTESDVPILGVGDDEHASVRIAALRRGADGVIRPGVVVDELIARIAAHLRRPTIRRSQTFAFGDVTMDLASRTCLVSGRDAGLTRIEFDLLAMLLVRMGDAVGRAQLAAAAMRSRSPSATRNLNGHICHVRKKLGKDGAHIQTLRGAGYRFAIYEAVSRHEHS